MNKKYEDEKLDLNQIKKKIKVKKSEISELEKRLNSSECNYNVGCSKFTFGTCTAIELIGVFMGVLITYTTNLLVGLMMYFVLKITSMGGYWLDEENKDRKLYNCMIQKYFSLIKSKIKKSNCKRKIKKLSNELKYLKIDLDIYENQINKDQTKTEVLENEPKKEQIRDIDVSTKVIGRMSQKDRKIYPNGDFSHYFDAPLEEKGLTLTKRK